MSHVIDQKKKLLARINRLIGQMEALKRAIETAENDEQCSQIMGQLASIRGAMNGLLLLFLDGHVREHVAAGRTQAERDVAAEDLMAALRSYRA
ncbi:MAG: metal/formaldehyde-sensitive transcriptional repressor [Myxococcota bacterium]|jgi:DNA-binding FrmR family transcriptional regulator|nr:metal/formaldehyde-sensitive transcriptional repressor [Myxococcota bacterium]